MNIVRRVGTTPQQRGSLSGDSCPDVFELDDGNYLVIGKLPIDSPDLTAKLKETGGSVGDDEQAVIVPADVLHAAAREIAKEQP